MELIPFSIIYLISCILSAKEMTILSALLLLIIGISLCFYYFKKYKTVLNPASIFSMSWVFCIGLANFKLSALQSIWSIKTWICFYLIFVLFILLFELGYSFKVGDKRQISDFEISSSTLKIIIFILFGLSVVSFLLEVLILGYVPLFTTDTPHAYSYFHVSGLHYFTVLCVLVPSFCVTYYMKGNRFSKSLCVDICLILSLLMPLLLVSRFQLVFSVLLAFLTFLFIYEKTGEKIITKRSVVLFIVSLVCLVALYVFITIERAHSVEYLNGIFEMKNPDTPIYITQPYIYIVNNFENFNCLINGLEDYALGLKQAFPFFALTGLKFLFPEMISFPLYLTKEELTTVTLFYDSYYDFGIIGCVLFSSILGFVYGYLFRIERTAKRDILTIIYAQLSAYLMLAFFTTWFSNPTTYFYFGICILIDLIIWFPNRQIKKG